MKKRGLFFYTISSLLLLLIWAVSIGLLSLTFSLIDGDVSFSRIKYHFLFINSFFIVGIAYLVYIGLSILGLVAVLTTILGLVGYAFKQIKRFRDGNIFELFFIDIEKLQKSLNKFQFLILILGFVAIISVLMLVSKENIYQPLLATIGGIFGGLTHYQDE